jgi:hypothetical protein
MKTEERIELKCEHLKPYIGTGLKALYGNPPNLAYKEVEIIGIEHRDCETHPTRVFADNMDSEHIWMFKPLLHPLSRLTEPILEDGKVPFIEMMKTEGHCDAYEEWWDNQEPRYEKMMKNCPMEIFELLLEWHFDVFGLIPKGLAEPIELTDKD